ncbi:MAG: aminomethyl-transferring glycine dehydrogenase subunit GcvPA [candidate division WOR-3 bacterium]
MCFTPHTDEDRRLMLERIGVRTVDELFAGIPKDIRLKRRLELPAPVSELEVLAELGQLAEANQDLICFAGCGAYDHFIPAVVDAIISRSEFYTAYTPYQAEVSQGTLQSIYEFQSLICRLFDMEVANASMYDCASALAEATHMARDITHRSRVLLSGGVNPRYVQVVQTYAQGLSIPVETVALVNDSSDLASLEKSLSSDVAAVIVQHPNFLGSLEPTVEIGRLAHAAGALLVVAVDPISLGILPAPGTYDADIVVAEGQSLGIPLSFGGPYLGLMATRRRYVRTMPGRLVARTTDLDGNIGYVLALQTREQHIRRERATSNICTNQALCALAASVYLSWMGPDGLREVATQCHAKSSYLASAIAKIPGFTLWNRNPYFKEFVVRTPVPARAIIAEGMKHGLLCGVDLGCFRREWESLLLVAVTEKRTRTELDAYARFLKQEFGSR